MSGHDYQAWQHQHWAESADDWEKWAEAVAPQAEGFNRPLIEAAGIGAGHRVLDMACGAGEPSLTAAAAVGPSGHVTASDYAAEMVAVTERRAKASGVANMAFQRADMADLPFDDASFEAVICRFGFMYTDAPDRCAAEVLRVLKSGGRVALMVWGPKPSNTVLSVAMEAGNAVVGMMDEDAAAHSSIYAEEGSMTGFFERAGFAEVKETDLQFKPSIPATMKFWTPIVGMNLGSAMRGMSQDEVKAVDDAIAAAYAPFIEDGKYRLSAHVRILSARKPG
ncbi:MAG: methyltransferase domain-containing protein [Alphaproteobacteria bacterium]